MLEGERRRGARANKRASGTSIEREASSTAAKTWTRVRKAACSSLPVKRAAENTSVRFDVASACSVDRAAANRRTKDECAFSDPATPSCAWGRGVG
jgi:hypothetical protein